MLDVRNIKKSFCILVTHTFFLFASLSMEQTPAGLVARTGESINVYDAYKDSRFANEIDPTTGTVVRSCLVSPILDKCGVMGKRLSHTN